MNNEKSIELLNACKRPEDGLETIKRLIDQGADPNTHTWGGTKKTSVLSNAISSGNIDLISLLLNHGADPNKVHRNSEYGYNEDIETPFHMALLLLFNNPSLMSLFVAKGAEINKEMISNMGNKGILSYTQGALHYAVRKESIDGVRALLLAGAKVDATREVKMTKVRTIVETALFIACRLFKNDQKSINLVTLLLQGGANVNSMRTETLGEIKRETVLHVAIVKRMKNLVWLLMEYGADSSIPFDDGTSLISVWDLCENDQVIKSAIIHKWSRKWFHCYSKSVQNIILSFLMIAKRQWVLDTSIQDHIISFIVSSF